MMIIKSVLHNIGVVCVGFCFGLIAFGIDKLFGFSSYASPRVLVGAIVLMAIGFVIRVWATAQFYENAMRVIKLEPQKKLITSGAYSFSRNPLYLGGNLFIFLGAVLVFGSPSGLILVLLELSFTDLFIRREERQLEEVFGDEWRQYKARVRRWI